MKKLLKYFGNGLLFLVPIGVTVYVVYWVFTSIDHGVSRVLGDEEGKLATGLGVLITLVVITGVGVLTRLFITRPLLQLIEKLFGRLPLIKLLYSSIKDLIGAFVGDKKKFDQPALVSLSVGGAKTLGFITRKSLDFWDMPDDVAVYLPQSYNFAGNMLIVPQSQVTLLDADSSEVMAFLVSGGVSGPKPTVKDNKEKK
jgi:uncharacterized membrane protein